MLHLKPGNEDTIVAQATAEGFAGIGVVRISGALARVAGRQILGVELVPRHAEYRAFKDLQGDIIDRGIALFFESPHSLTGEDVLELQAHGGPIVMARLIKTAMSLGMRMARPGEFLERAFLNQKIDLVQAEAIHDLIHATTLSAARGALRSLQGEFSRTIQDFSQALTHLRMHIEAAIDFPEESLDLIHEGEVPSALVTLIDNIARIEKAANEGAKLSRGMRVVIIGKPNAGKSSLLNALTGFNAAIVTEFAGTTRDVLREEIQLGSTTLELIDTAGIREALDPIEQIGIARAKEVLQGSDHIVLVLDATVIENKIPTDYLQEWPEIVAARERGVGLTLLLNKIDALDPKKVFELQKILKDEPFAIFASAKTQEGLSHLRDHLRRCAESTHLETAMSARQRHVDAISRANHHLKVAEKELPQQKNIEIVAEELRCAQLALDEILGRFSSDDLLGKIFSEFCIGK